MKNNFEKQPATWVIKIGSGVLFNGQARDEETFTKLIETISLIRASGRKVVIVSSGAVALGRTLLKERTFGVDMAHLQALAAIGQVSLIELYRQAFQNEGGVVAQVLFGRDDINDRRRYLNAEETLGALLHADIIPIINENDTVSTDELRFGDNDELAAMTCGLVSAEVLIIFSVASGIRERLEDEGSESLGEVIPEIKSDDPRLDTLALATTSVHGRGGMESKILACKLAARFNTNVAIANGKEPNQILSLAGLGKTPFKGTLVIPSGDALRGPKIWLTAAARISGTIYCDDGAKGAIQKRGSSLLPAGIIRLKDDFLRGEVVELCDEKGEPFARGVATYTSQEIGKIMGKKSEDIQTLLGFHLSDTVIHRDSLVVY